jgi:hypothetical protein
MTEEQKTELIYLQDLVFESARWRISEDDDLSPIEREVRDRLDKLQAAMNGEEPAEGPVPDSGCTVLPAFPPWGSQIPETKAGDRKIKINYRGRLMRLPAYMLEKTPCKSSHTGYSWKVKDEYVAEADAKMKLLDAPLRVNEPAVDKLSDELWTEHENAAGDV